MADQKIKFKVSIKELSFEFEGSRDIGQALQVGLTRSLGQLVDTQRTVMTLPGAPAIVAPVANDIATQTLFSEVPASVAPMTNGHAAGPQEKQARKARKGGPTLAALVRELKLAGFFTEPRSMAAILDKLKVSGRNVKSNSISGTLQTMAQNKELFRNQAGD